MTNVKDLIAGVFVLVAILLFVLFVAWAGNIDALFSRRQEVRVLLREAVPLGPGTAVRYEGLRAGSVERLHVRTRAERQRTHPDFPVRVDLEVGRDLVLRQGTRVLVGGDGLLGARFVHLLAAPLDAPPLREGEPLLGELAGVDSLLARAGELTGGLALSLSRLARLLDPAGGSGTLPGLITGVERLTERAEAFARAAETTRSGLDAVLAEARTTLAAARRLVRETEPRLSDLFAGLGAVPAEATSALGELRDVARETESKLAGLIDEGRGAAATLRETVAGIGRHTTRSLARIDDLLVRNDRNVFLALHHLRVAAEQLKIAVARVRADPSQLLFGGRENPDTAEAEVRRSQERDLLDRGFLPPRWRR